MKIVFKVCLIVSILFSISCGNQEEQGIQNSQSIGINSDNSNESADFVGHQYLEEFIQSEISNLFLGLISYEYKFFPNTDDSSTGRISLSGLVSTTETRIVEVEDVAAKRNAYKSDLANEVSKEFSFVELDNIEKLAGVRIPPIYFYETIQPGDSSGFEVEIMYSEKVNGYDFSISKPIVFYQDILSGEPYSVHIERRESINGATIYGQDDYQEALDFDVERFINVLTDKYQDEYEDLSYSRNLLADKTFGIYEQFVDNGKNKYKQIGSFDVNEVKLGVVSTVLSPIVGVFLDFDLMLRGVTTNKENQIRIKGNSLPPLFEIVIEEAGRFRLQEGSDFSNTVFKAFPNLWAWEIGMYDENGKLIEQ